MADWVKYRVNRALMYHRTKLHNIYKLNKSATHDHCSNIVSNVHNIFNSMEYC